MNKYRIVKKPASSLRPGDLVRLPLGVLRFVSSESLEGGYRRAMFEAADGTRYSQTRYQSNWFDRVDGFTDEHIASLLAAEVAPTVLQEGGSQ